MQENSDPDSTPPLQPQPGGSEPEQTPPDLAPHSGSSWSQRKGKGLFWCLLFTPAPLCLAALAISLALKIDSPGVLIGAAVIGSGICLYCGMWLARGFQIPKVGQVLSGIGLSLAFVGLNFFVVFAGCFAVLMAFNS